MIFDNEGICVGFNDPLIHVFNKNEANVIKTSHYTSIKQRRNVILLGDSIGDLKMADGLDHDVTLTIGFLNHDTEELIESYMDKFDIVVTNDSSFEMVCDLLDIIE